MPTHPDARRYRRDPLCVDGPLLPPPGGYVLLLEVCDHDNCPALADEYRERLSDVIEADRKDELGIDPNIQPVESHGTLKDHFQEFAPHWDFQRPITELLYHYTKRFTSVFSVANGNEFLAHGHRLAVLAELVCQTLRGFDPKKFPFETRTLISTISAFAPANLHQGCSLDPLYISEMPGAWCTVWADRPPAPPQPRSGGPSARVVCADTPPPTSPDATPGGDGAHSPSITTTETVPSPSASPCSPASSYAPSYHSRASTFSNAPPRFANCPIGLNPDARHSLRGTGHSGKGAPRGKGRVASQALPPRQHAPRPRLDPTKMPQENKPRFLVDFEALPEHAHPAFRGITPQQIADAARRIGDLRHPSGIRRLFTDTNGFITERHPEGALIQGLYTPALDWRNPGALETDIPYGLIIYPEHCRLFNQGLCFRPRATVKTKNHCNTSHACSLCNGDHPLWRCSILPAARAALKIEHEHRQMHGVPPEPVLYAENTRHGARAMNWDTESILRDSNEVHQEALDQLRSPNLDRSVQHVEDLVRLHTDALARNIEVLQAIDARGTRRSPTSGSRSRVSSGRGSSPPPQ